MTDNKNIQPKNIGRRSFIKSAATLGVGATVIAGSSIANAAAQNSNGCKTSGCDYDVVVIGGGNAGAAAARDAMKNGYKTLILEARNRLGGRTFSSELDHNHVELGGLWIHNTQPFVWAEVERYGLEVKETPGAAPEAMYMILDDGKHMNLTLEQFGEIAAGWEAYTATAREVIPRPYDILFNKDAAYKADKINALEQLNKLGLSPIQKGFNQCMVELIGHRSPLKMSYLEIMRYHLLGGGCFSTFMDSTTRFKLKDGTISLVNKMIEDGGPEVKLSTPVKSVEDIGEKVVISTTRGDKITCGAVISTLPMNTIANVDFTPALPLEVVQAGKERAPGNGLKIYIKVKGDVGNIASVAPGRPLNYTMTYDKGEDFTLLVAFGNDVEAIDVYDDEAIEKALSLHIPGVKVLSTMAYDWNNDPYSKGTWATYHTGWIEKYYDAFQKENGRIFFASGDHGEGWRGTIDGAIGAGIRAARKVNDLLK